MEMVSKGDGETTDIYARHLKTGGGKDMYDALHDDLLIFAFGQATTSQEVSTVCISKSAVQRSLKGIIEIL